MLGKILRILYFEVGFKLRYLFWKVIITSSGGRIGNNVKIYEGVRIVLGNPGSIDIGSNVRLLRNATIGTSGSGKIHIGNGVHIGEGTIIYSDLEISINDKAVIGPQNVIVDFDHNYQDRNTPIIEQGHNAKRVMIAEDVWISSHCSVIKGVLIGKGSVIGAGSVVNKEISPYSIACGVPAKVIKRRGE